MLALAGGLLYAARERIREVGRKWLRSGVERLTAQRVTRFVEVSPDGGHHDPVKPIAVLDRGGDRLRLVHAPRTYRIPVRLSIRGDGRREERTATLVVNKFGLHRIDPDE